MQEEPKNCTYEDSTLDEDFVTKAAIDTFGISYLYPWQRIVISNILDAQKSLEQIQKENADNVIKLSTESASEPTDEEKFGTDKEDIKSLVQEQLSSIKEYGIRQNLNDLYQEDELDYEDCSNFDQVSNEETKTEIETKEIERDIFCLGRQIVLLPTGAGKSMCFLVPAMLLSGPTLVLYPLLALMSDQKRRMDEGKIKNVMFKGGQSAQEREAAFKEIENGAKIILANPEVLQNKKLVERLSNYNICHIAIDEAHCVSEWGDTFRPAYLTLGKIIKQLKCNVITAFTATASPPILNRISQVLFDGKAHVVQSDSDRPNIHYNVINAYDKKKAAFILAKKEEKPLIIFCGTRNKSEDMARELSILYGKDKVRFYHAGLEKSEKEKVEKWFYDKNDGILCCTCAYGMGVDKKNIRTVIHLEPSPTAESYLQEAGRGGRDGGISNAILLWSPQDARKARKTSPGSRQRVLAEFAESSTCRRKILLNALGDGLTYCAGCDVCKTGGPAPFASDGKYVLNLIRKNNKTFSKATAAQATMDSLNKRDFRIFEKNIWDNKDAEEIITTLKKEGYVRTCIWPWKGLLATGKKNKRYSDFYRSKFYKKIAKTQRKINNLISRLRKKIIS